MHLLFSFATLFSSISNRTCLNWLFVICTASKLLAVQCLCMSARDERRWGWGGLLWKDVGSVCHKVNFGHAQYHVMCFLTSFNMCVCVCMCCLCCICFIIHYSSRISRDCCVVPGMDVVPYACLHSNPINCKNVV